MGSFASRYQLILNFYFSELKAAVRCLPILQKLLRLRPTIESRRIRLIAIYSQAVPLRILISLPDNLRHNFFRRQWCCHLLLDIWRRRRSLARILCKFIKKQRTLFFKKIFSRRSPPAKRQKPFTEVLSPMLKKLAKTASRIVKRKKTASPKFCRCARGNFLLLFSCFNYINLGCACFPTRQKRKSTLKQAIKTIKDAANCKFKCVLSKIKYF